MGKKAEVGLNFCVLLRARDGSFLLLGILPTLLLDKAQPLRVKTLCSSVLNVFYTSFVHTQSFLKVQSCTYPSCTCIEDLYSVLLQSWQEPAFRPTEVPWLGSLCNAGYTFPSAGIMAWSSGLCVQEVKIQVHKSHFKAIAEGQCSWWGVIAKLMDSFSFSSEHPLILIFSSMERK